MSRTPRKRLGRGLGALLGEEYLEQGGASGSGEVLTLPVASIRPNPFQPRRDFSPEELNELRSSIRENGLLQPLLVRPIPGGKKGEYQLVAGERRLRSVTGLGWTEVPAMVRQVDDPTLLVLALVENLQREALNPMEEAEGYQTLADEFDLTQAEIADAVGKSRSSVANSLRLLRLPPSVRRMVNDGTLSMGHARALLGVEDGGRLTQLARQAAEAGWSVREVERRVRRGQGSNDSTGRSGTEGSPGSRSPGETDPVRTALEEELAGTLGTRVQLRVRKSDGAGSLQIPFSSPGDFDRIFEIITGRSSSEIAG